MNDLSNIDKFNQFLTNHYIDDKGKSIISHVEFCPGVSRGRYYISDNDYPIFFELYQKALDNNLKLIELPKTLSPIKIDLDFRFDTEYKEHQYTQDNIEKFIKACFFEIDKYLEIEDSQKISFTYEIPDPVVETKQNKDKKTVYTYKDGIHIMFPYIVTKKNVQHIIRENILEVFDDIFEKDKVNYINKKEDIVDKSIIDKNGWVMYGSSKPGRVPYKLTKIYKYSSNIIDQEIELIEEDINIYSLEEIIKLSSIRNKDEETVIKEDRKKEVTEYGNKMNKKELKRNITKNNKITEEPEVIEKYLDMLLPFRRDNYNNWLEIGMALHNIGEGDEEYLALWDNFSKDSDKYEYKCCHNKWRTFTKCDDSLTIGSIRYWAQQDNSSEYIKYTYELGIYNDIILKCLDDPYDNHIANVITALYNEQFIYDPNNSEWYHFTEHRWVCIKKEPLILLKYLSNDIVMLFHKYFNKVFIKNWQEKDNMDDKINAAKNAEKIYKIIEKKLKDNGPKARILNETREGFKNDDFLTQIDLNKNLIGFKNGVYDLKNKCFRNGRSNDFITMSTNYDYINYDSNDPVFQEVKDFIKCMQPDITEDDTQRRKYLKRYMASILQSVNTDETFHIFTGGGRNGKSKLIELLEKSLGDYAGKLSISSLTKPRKNASDASPEQVIIRNKKLVTMQECDPNEKLNNGILKEYSGGDQVTGRGLYKDPLTFKPQFKMIMVVNDIPLLQNPNDPATFERLRAIFFPVHFVREDPTDVYEKPIDLTISEKIEVWAPYFMTLLIMWFHKYFPDNRVKLVPPNVVKRFTDEYRNNNDKWNEFYQTIITVTNTKNKSDKADIKDEIYKPFKIWCRGNDMSKMPEYMEFKGDLLKRFKISNDKIKNHIISGWKVIKN